MITKNHMAEVIPSKMLEKTPIQVPKLEIDQEELKHFSRVGILAEDLEEENDSEDEGIEDYKEGGYHPVFVGECLIGRYVVLQKLGWGHFSTVWLCKDLKYETYVAIKLQKSASHYLEAAFDEVEILQKAVKHAQTKEWFEDLYKFDEGRKKNYSREDCYTVQLLNAFIYQGPYGKHFCMVFEILGVNLLEIIKRYKYKGIPINICRKMSRQILIGLHYLHKHCGIIHTDLKPENVLLCLDEEDLADIIKHKQLYKNDATEKRLAKLRFKIDSDFKGELPEKEENKNEDTREKKSEDSDKENKLLGKDKQNVKNNEEELQRKISNANEKVEKNLNFSKKTSVSRVIDEGEGVQVEKFLKQEIMEVENDFQPKKMMESESENVSNLEDSKEQSMNSLPSEKVFNLMILTPQEMFREVERIVAREGIEDKNEVKNVKKRIKKKMKRHKKRWAKMTEKEKREYELAKESLLLREKHKQAFSLVEDQNIKMEVRTNGQDPPKVEDESAVSLVPFSKATLTSTNVVRFNEDAGDASVGLKSNFKVKIADLGNGCWTHYHFQPEIQTRQYRGPEVILGINYNETADLWSFACMLFEMLTGDFLFDPKKSKEFNKNDDHLAQMIELLNELPKDWSTIGTGSKKYFDKDGRLKKIRTLRFWGLKDILMQRYKMAEHEAVALEDFLMPMLRILPQERATAAEMLNHHWLDMSSTSFKTKDPTAVLQNDEDRFKKIINEQDTYADYSQSESEEESEDEDLDFKIEGRDN